MGTHDTHDASEESLGKFLNLFMFKSVFIFEEDWFLTRFRTMQMSTSIHFQRSKLGSDHPKHKCWTTNGKGDGAFLQFWTSI